MKVIISKRWKEMKSNRTWIIAVKECIDGQLKKSRKTTLKAGIFDGNQKVNSHVRSEGVTKVWWND